MNFPGNYNPSDWLGALSPSDRQDALTLLNRNGGDGEKAAAELMSRVKRRRDEKERSYFHLLSKAMKDEICNGQRHISDDEFSKRLTDAIALRISLEFEVIHMAVVLLLYHISKVGVSVWCRT